MKREVILCTAARLFAERGFSNTSTILLAQEAGVAEGTIFRHFKSKENIFCVLVDNVKKQLVAHIRKYLADRRPVTGMEAVLSIARAFCLFVRKNRMEFALIFREVSVRYGDENDEVFLTIRAIHDELGVLLREALEQGQADGSVSRAMHPYDTSALLVCMLVGFMRSLHFKIIRLREDSGPSTSFLLTSIERMLSPSLSLGVEAGTGGIPESQA